MNNLSINGRTSFNFSYDGVTNKDTGQNGGNFAAPALDSIAEVRVQASNFQAEYGRSSGATITVVTRSGSRDFHGSAAFYKRDDALERQRVLASHSVRPGPDGAVRSAALHVRQHRVDDRRTGAHPEDRPSTGTADKLFFFWSQDILGRTDPGNLNQRRVPTALERQGDFSQTFDNQGRLIFIRDPLLPGNCAATTGGPACFPGNVIPANRIDANARALLNLFPLPNATDPTGTNQFNYVFQTEQDWPRNDQVLRVDWNIAPGTTAYGRLQYGYEKRSGGVSLLGSTGGWPQMPTKYEIDTVSYVNTLLHTFSPTLYGEFTVGVNWAHQYTSPFDDAGARRERPAGWCCPACRSSSRRRIRSPSFRRRPSPAAFPATRSSSASSSGSRSSGTTRCSTCRATSRRSSGAHTMKAGLFVEHTTRPAARTSSFNGNLQLQHRRLEPIEHERRVCEWAARRHHRVHRVGRPSLGARPVPHHRVVRAGQLAREAKLHAGCRRPLLLHDADAKRG